MRILRPGTARGFERQGHRTPEPQGRDALKKITSVEDFLDRKVAPAFLPIVARLRTLMKKHAPDATEVISYGILGWKMQRIIAVVSPTKKDITFAFSRGAEFDDTFGLLRGVGKVSKHVKIRNVAEINEAALRDYIQQALTLENR